MKTYNRNGLKISLAKPGNLSTAGNKLFRISVTGTQAQIQATVGKSRQAISDYSAWYRGTTVTTASREGYISESASSNKCHITVAPDTTTMALLIENYIQDTKLTKKTYYLNQKTPFVYLFIEASLFGTTAFGGVSCCATSLSSKICSPKIFKVPVASLQTPTAEPRYYFSTDIGPLSSDMSAGTSNLLTTASNIWDVTENMNMTSLGGIIVNRAALVVVSDDAPSSIKTGIVNCDVESATVARYSSIESLLAYADPTGTKYKIIYKTDRLFDLSSFNRLYASQAIDTPTYTGTLKSGYARTDIPIYKHRHTSHVALGEGGVANWVAYDTIIPPIFASITPVSTGSNVCSIPTDRGYNLNFVPLYGCSYSIWGVQASQRYGDFYIQSGSINCNQTSSGDVYSIGAVYSQKKASMTADATVHVDEAEILVGYSAETAAYSKTQIGSYYDIAFGVTSDTYKLASNNNAVPLVYNGPTATKRRAVKNPDGTTFNIIDGSPNPIATVGGYYKDASKTKPYVVFFNNPNAGALCAYTIYSSYTLL